MAIFWRHKPCGYPFVAYRSLDGITVDCKCRGDGFEGWERTRHAPADIDAKPEYGRCNADGTWLVEKNESTTGYRRADGSMWFACSPEPDHKPGIAVCDHPGNWLSPASYKLIATFERVEDRDLVLDLHRRSLQPAITDERQAELVRLALELSTFARNDMEPGFDPNEIRCKTVSGVTQIYDLLVRIREIGSSLDV